MKLELPFLALLLSFSFAGCAGLAGQRGLAEKRGLVPPAIGEPDDLHIHVAPARPLDGSGLLIPEIRLGGELRYARLTLWIDEDGDGRPSKSELVHVIELRGPGPIWIRNQRMKNHRRLMAEIHVQNARGGTRRHAWHLDCHAPLP